MLVFDFLVMLNVIVLLDGVGFGKVVIFSFVMCSCI